MKKKFFFGLLLMLLSTPFTVLAAEVENTCNYESEIDGDDIHITCEFYSDNSKPTCVFSTLEVEGNSETLSNWGKVFNGDGDGVAGTWYKQNKKCIPYIVYVEKDALINGYELAGFGTMAEANAYSIEQSKWYKTAVVGQTKSDDTIEDEINGYIEMLNDIGTFFELDDYCELKDGKYSVSTSGYSQKLCTDAINSLYDKINEWDNNIRNWVSKAEISSDAEVIKKYNEARKKARDQIYYLWDDDLIDDPSDDPINDPDDGKKDPEYNSSSQTCVSCGDGALTNVPQQLPMFVRNLIWLIQILTPVILIGLGIYDFIKAIMASDEKIMKESQNRFIKRIIAAVLIFLVVAIVKFVFSLIPNSTDVLSCIPCFISDADSCSEPYTCKTVEFDAGIDTDIETSGGDNQDADADDKTESTDSTSYNSKKDCEAAGYIWEEYKYSSGAVYGGKCTLKRTASYYKNKKDCEDAGYTWEEYKYSSGAVYGGNCS